MNSKRKRSPAYPAITLEEAIERAIDLCDGNVPKAATLLGISTSTIYRKKQIWSNR